MHCWQLRVANLLYGKSLSILHALFVLTFKSTIRTSCSLNVTVYIMHFYKSQEANSQKCGKQSGHCCIHSKMAGAVYHATSVSLFHCLVTQIGEVDRTIS